MANCDLCPFQDYLPSACPECPYPTIVTADKCPKCDGELDTGWECNKCGYDAKHFVRSGFGLKSRYV